MLERRSDRGTPRVNARMDSIVLEEAEMNQDLMWRMEDGSNEIELVCE